MGHLVHLVGRVEKVLVLADALQWRVGHAFAASFCAVRVDVRVNRAVRLSVL